jgi:DegV family protein with EDD domain
MSLRVAVVTDSTAYLTPEETDELDIAVVPLQVIVGGRAFDDLPHGDAGAIDAEGVAAALKEWSPVTTSRPAPSRFAEAYRAAAEAGAAGAVSIHLSGELSGTVEAARIAAREAPIPVEVIDSRSLAMGLGFPVLAAAREARRGATLPEVVELARRRIAACRSFFYVDTLEYLRRGGRIGAAATLVGSALAIKPLLHIVDGAIVPLEKVRTATRAIARLEDLAVQAAAAEPVDVAVHHLGARARADALADRLRPRIPELGHLLVVEVGAVIGAHAGPGMLGVTVAPSC